ncbi:MAG: histidine phosphatase family protein [Patescibacteria group bacterium]
MGKIILARHGQDEDNANGILNGRRNSPLTAIGVAQAYELADELKIVKLDIGHIFSSPYQRAARTAEICSQVLKIPHTVLECLIERSHGILEGHPYSDIPLLAKSYKEMWGFTYVLEVEGGENYQDLCLRADVVLWEIKNKILELEIQKDVLVISHGAISRALETVHKGLSHEHIFDFTSFSNCEFRILE